MLVAAVQLLPLTCVWQHNTGRYQWNSCHRFSHLVSFLSSYSHNIWGYSQDDFVSNTWCMAFMFMSLQTLLPFLETRGMLLERLKAALGGIYLEFTSSGDTQNIHRSWDKRQKNHEKERLKNTLVSVSICSPFPKAQISRHCFPKKSFGFISFFIFLKLLCLNNKYDCWFFFFLIQWE